MKSVQLASGSETTDVSAPASPSGPGAEIQSPHEPAAATNPPPERIPDRPKQRIGNRIAAEWRKVSFYQRLRLFTLVLGLPIAFFIATRNVEPSFVVAATAERVHFGILPKQQPRWKLSGVTIVEGTASSAAETPFNGSVVPSVGSEITIRRISQGSVVLAIDGGEQSSGELFDSTGVRVARLEPTAMFRWDSVASRTVQGRTITFSLEEGVALTNLGERPTYQTTATPLLRSGRVSLLKRSWKILGGGIQEIGSETLQLGDQLTFAAPSPAKGFISVDERAALNASIRVVTNEAWITPTGGTPRDVTATYYDYLRNDRAFQLVVVIFGFLYGVLKILGPPDAAKKSVDGAETPQTSTPGNRVDSGAPLVQPATSPAADSVPSASASLVQPSTRL